MVWYGMVWYGMVWYGMVWYGMVWYGMVWYGMVSTVCDKCRTCSTVCDMCLFDMGCVTEQCTSFQSKNVQCQCAMLAS